MSEKDIPQIDKSTPVIVFGGAGFVGTHLLRRLSNAGVTQLISVDIKDPKMAVAGVKYLKHDICDLKPSDLDIKSPLIFNFAAVHTTPGHEPWEYYRTNILGAVNICRYARAADAKRIIFTSSISVYGPNEVPKDEATPPTPNSDYGRSKFMAEQIHTDWQLESDDRKLVIVRPAVVFGQGEGGNFTRLAKLLKKGFFIFPGRKDTIKSCIDVDTLIDWMLYAHSLDKDRILFNGSYSNRYTIEEIVDTFREVAFPSAKKFLIPAPALLSIAAILRPISAATGFGIHPDRILKLMISTNILPTWAERQGLDTRDGLRDALIRWRNQENGEFS